MTGEQKESAKVLERTIMFNDAVFAIALTLLVLEIRLPEFSNIASPGEMLHQLHLITPKFLAFLLSALLVSGNWITSINIQRTLAQSDPGFIVFMATYLIIISLMPFCCNVIGSYPDNPVSFVVFGIVNGLLLVNAFFFMRHCGKKNLFHPDADLDEIKKLEKMMPVLLLFMTAMTALAFYSTHLSFVMFLLWNLLPFFITRSLRIKHKD